jgi:hypothetical protein
LLDLCQHVYCLLFIFILALKDNANLLVISIFISLFITMMVFLLVEQGSEQGVEFMANYLISMIVCYKINKHFFKKVNYNVSA